MFFVQSCGALWLLELAWLALRDFIIIIIIIIMISQYRHTYIDYRIKHRIFIIYKSLY